MNLKIAIFVFVFDFIFPKNRNIQSGESHNDVQRTAASNDQTDSACLKSLPNKYCIGLCCILLVLSTYLPLLHQMTSIESIVSLVNLAKFKTKINRNYLSRMNNNNKTNNVYDNEFNLMINQNYLSTVSYQQRRHICWWHLVIVNKF